MAFEDKKHSTNKELKEFFHLTQTICEKLTVNIISGSECFPYKIRGKIRISALATSHIVLVILVRKSSKRKKQ